MQKKENSVNELLQCCVPNTKKKKKADHFVLVKQRRTLN